jgi:hypothetical protein
LIGRHLALQAAASAANALDGQVAQLLDAIARGDAEGNIASRKDRHTGRRHDRADIARHVGRRHAPFELLGLHGLNTRVFLDKRLTGLLHLRLNGWGGKPARLEPLACDADTLE